MPIFKPVQEQDANESVSESYAKIKARYGGRLPDIYKAMANDPEYLASLNEHMTRVLAPRNVDARTKEVIAFVVAAMNQCDFCLNAHTHGLRRHGYDDEGIAEILGTVALWSEVTRFNIGARVTWPAE
ncbi:MAG TPA: carboxymuconolactone decarboxylase family protein [Chloroflexota bacterium]|nr:carboxymuconolactone decarboxylase family protein [Chloroflexota bacterium]